MTTMLLTTLFTPDTFLASFSAFVFWFAFSTLPLERDHAVFHVDLKPAALYRGVFSQLQLEPWC